MQDLEQTSAASDARKSATWGWFKNSLVLLLMCIIIVPAGWFATGVLVEHRIQQTVSTLERQGRVELIYNVGFSGCRVVRFPVWVPNFVRNRWADKWPFWEDYVLGCRLLSDASDADMALINQLPEAGWFIFDDATEISDAALQTFFETHNLSFLEFKQPRQLTKQHLETLIRSKELYVLRGVAGDFDQNFLDGLKRMPQLDRLQLVGPISPPARVETIIGIPELREFCWRNSQMTDKQLSALMAYPIVPPLLELYGTQLTSESWKSLRSLNVGTLVLESTHIDDQLADEFSGGGPERLRLRGGQLSDDGLEKLLKCSFLKDLEIETGNLSLASAKLLAKSRAITTLTLRGGPEINDKWLKELASGSFVELHIIGSSITDDGVEHLKGHLGLTQLTLPNSRITDRSMAIFSALCMTGLSYLDLRNTAITDEGLRQLAMGGIEFLPELHLGGTQVTAKAVKEYAGHRGAEIHGVDLGARTRDVHEVQEKDWFKSLDRERTR